MQATYTPKATHLTKNVPPQKSRIGNASRLEGGGAAMMRHAMEKYPPQKSRTGSVSRLEEDFTASRGHTMEKYTPQKFRTGSASRLEGDGAASRGYAWKNEGREVEGAEDPPQMEAENGTRATNPIHI